MFYRLRKAGENMSVESSVDSVEWKQRAIFPAQDEDVLVDVIVAAVDTPSDPDAVEHPEGE